MARRFLDNDLSFGDADEVMNWVWARVTDCARHSPFPEPAFSIFQAVDEGEYHHAGDDDDVDPVEKYTKPKLLAALNEIA